MIVIYHIINTKRIVTRIALYTTQRAKDLSAVDFLRWERELWVYACIRVRVGVFGGFCGRGDLYMYASCVRVCLSGFFLSLPDR